MLLVSWILGSLVLLTPVCADKVLHLHEWYSDYVPAFHSIIGHVPASLKDSKSIAYVIGSRRDNVENHILNVNTADDANPYWILESTTDVKFVGLISTPFKKSPNQSSISAEDRCQQLQPESR